MTVTIGGNATKIRNRLSQNQHSYVSKNGIIELLYVIDNILNLTCLGVVTIKVCESLCSL